MHLKNVWRIVFRSWTRRLPICGRVPYLRCNKKLEIIISRGLDSCLFRSFHGNAESFLFYCSTFGLTPTLTPRWRYITHNCSHDRKEMWKLFVLEANNLFSVQLIDYHREGKVCKLIRACEVESGPFTVAGNFSAFLWVVQLKDKTSFSLLSKGIEQSGAFSVAVKLGFVCHAAILAGDKTCWGRKSRKCSVNHF